jgi:serine/threonine protein kinase
MAGRTKTTLEEFCQALRTGRLLSAGEIDRLRQRWQREAEDPDSLAEFTRWLVTGGHVTEYQVERLLRGRTHFFLGDYKLLDELEDSPSARVFKAQDRLDRVVILRTLPPSRADNPQALAGHRRQVRLMAGLDHPQLIRCLEAGDYRGMHYLVLEHLEGERLDQRLARQGRLAVAEAVELGLQVLDGLQHLHEKGVVHRNLEPANLMLLPGEEPDRFQVKILDFSRARASSGAVGDLEDATAEETGEAPGLYTAPELAEDVNRADIRGDLYSLGCILYHSLAGTPPFQETGRPASPPSLNEVNPEVGKGLAGVVAILMAVSPAYRYSTPAEAGAALRKRQSEAVPVEPPPSDNPPPVRPPPLPPVPAPPAEEPAGPADLGEPEPTPSFEPPPLPSVPAARGRIARRPESGLDRRDWWMVVLGAALLLIVQGLAWVAARALLLWRTLSDEDNRRPPGRP